MLALYFPISAKLRALVVPAQPQEATGESQLAATESGCAQHHPARMSWARLLKRVFEIDLEHCPNCGGDLKIIAAIRESAVIERILTHLGLQARAPPRAPARGQMQHAEPGHKQSSGLFVPGEEAGHWPGAACKARDLGSTLPFISDGPAPGAEGSG